MDENGRITELEAEVAELRARLVHFEAPPAGEPAIVTRLLAKRELLALLPDIVAILDGEWRILYLNRAVPGRTPEEFIGSCVLDHLVEEERASRRAALERAWQTGEPQSTTSRSSNGFSWENRIVPIEEDGRVVCILNTAADVTEREQAVEALRESASKLRHALDATGMGTWVRDASGVRWDAALCRILGVDPATAPTANDAFFDFIHPDDREATRQAVTGFRQKGVFDELECRIVRPDGSVRHVIVKASIELDAEGKVARSYGGVLDVTERKALEERLRQSEKMDAIGHLTAGIAHNFNNVLGVILPNVELSRRNATPQVNARLDDIAHAAERGAEMVRQLMLFARRQVSGRKEAFDVAECARRTVSICRSTFDPTVRIDLSIEPELPNVLGYDGQIEQVLLNICLNARDALEEARRTSPEIRLSVERTPSGSVLIQIADNGPGMDEATRERVFDPFFTTKDAQRGTGLGLASALAIVTDHGGLIACRSRLGEGTTFEIELPATDRPVVQRLSTASEPEQRGDETILLADDEPLVRQATKELLELGGYAVLEAADGTSALEQFERERARISAVILDRSMPGLSGDQVLEGIAAVAPEVPVVMLSGHLGGSESWGRAAAVLTKPTSTETLLRTVRSVIDRTRERESRTAQ